MPECAEVPGCWEFSEGINPMVCSRRATTLVEGCYGPGFPLHEWDYPDRPIRTSYRELPIIDAVEEPRAIRGAPVSGQEGSLHQRWNKTALASSRPQF